MAWAAHPRPVWHPTADISFRQTYQLPKYSTSMLSEVEVGFPSWCPPLQRLKCVRVTQFRCSAICLKKAKAVAGTNWKPLECSQNHKNGAPPPPMHPPLMVGTGEIMRQMLKLTLSVEGFQSMKCRQLFGHKWAKKFNSNCNFKILQIFFQTFWRHLSFKKPVKVN